ncbi:MAG: histidinol-phosphate transaminase [Nanoarchaeota archaeon]|nr:histidinol-phosphate transaminase [Nanoarchaeota archaeon]
MSTINGTDVNLLISHYEKFCQSVEYRRNEEFYSKENPIIELSYNENPLGPGQMAINAIKYHSEFAHLYPPIDYHVLIERLATQLNLSNKNVLISAGSVAAIYLAVFQFAGDGDQVIYSKSSIPWYRWCAVGNNSIPVEVPLLPDMNHDLESILKSINNRTKVIILSNPHNPTGLYIAENQLLDFYKRIPENVLLIVDQAYYEYQSTQETLLIKLVNEVPNLMLTRTFSKIHGLAGLRVGYAMSNERTISALKAKWLGSMPTISTLSVFAALHALDDKAHIEKSILYNNKIKSDLNRIATEFNLRSLNSEANFITINIHDSIKNENLFTMEGIRFTPGYFYGYKEWARFSFHYKNELMINKIQYAFSLISKL